MNKTVFITGTSSGFGRHTAERFARAGWNVVATMRNTEAGWELAVLPNVLVTHLDVQNRASIEQAAATGIARFGSIDVLVNNAGFSLFGVFESIPVEKVKEQFDVNVFGVMEVTRVLLPHFREKKAGVIVNISSGAGVFGLPMISLYNASKFALEGFSESLSYELLGLGIVVKLVEPGGVITTNFGQRLTAEFAANGNAPKDYDDFIARTGAVFEELRAARLATSEEVAEVIFEAATDGTERLRYIATGDILPLVKARRETSEGEYIGLMRGKFLRRA